MFGLIYRGSHIRINKLGIFWDGKIYKINLCFAPNYIKQNYLFCRLKIMVEKFKHCKLFLTKQHFMKLRFKGIKRENFF